MTEPDWWDWHAPYDDRDSSLSRRLRAVQTLVAAALDASPSGPVNLVSMCAGQGRDVSGVLRDHPRRGDVRALLVERDERNVAAARSRTEDLDAEVEVRAADAGSSESYIGFLPAEVVLVCGVFGNISDDDIAGTIDALPALCAADATVIWTRHRGAPDLTPRIREWFAQASFTEEAFVAPADTSFGVGAHRFRGAPRPHTPMRLFDFVG